MSENSTYIIIMQNEKKYRNELKYICTEADLAILESRIKVLCKRDPHVGSSGTYDIRSIYFDDVNDSCFNENESGADPRAKFRIRIYNGNANRITLEKKSKSHGMTHKDSAILSRDQFNDIMSGKPSGLFKNSSDSAPLLNQFEALMYTKGYRPKTIVAYKRTPFVFKAGNVRITLDRNIGHTDKFDLFFDETLPSTPVLANGTHILEVKYDELLPDFLYNALNLDGLKYTNFSKYYLSRKRL